MNPTDEARVAQLEDSLANFASWIQSLDCEIYLLHLEIEELKAKEGACNEEQNSSNPA